MKADIDLQIETFEKTKAESEIKWEEKKTFYEKEIERFANIYKYFDNFSRFSPILIVLFNGC